MKPYAPDINNPYPKPKPKPHGNGGGNGGPNNLPAFQPGQLNALASQLNGSFGGGLGAWKKDFRNTYNPTSSKEFNFGGGHGNGGGNNIPGGNPDPRGPGGTPNQPPPGFDPSSPRSRMAPMQMPQQGLLGAKMQPQQQQGLLGDIPPEVLAFIRSRGVS